MTLTAMNGYRALDLTDDKGFICGRMLGDLGVDVIKVEPPGGELSRRFGPFYKDIPDTEKSLNWFAFNTNKRGITLDLESAEGREIFKKLAKTAHFVIESFSPGFIDSLGLGYPVLSRINPAIVVTSITPFGQTGPYSDYKASDIIGMAMCGLMYLCGDPDKPPVRITFPQAYLHAGAEAAVGTMIAHYYRESTGKGQWVDISMQEAARASTMNAPPFWELNKIVLKRAGSLRAGLSSNVNMRQVWPCLDGYVIFPLYGGATGASTNSGLTRWIEGEGIADDFLSGKHWNTFDIAQITPEDAQHFETLLLRFFQRYTKQQLYEGGLQRNIMIYPVYTIEDITQDTQLQSREFWQTIEHPELGEAIVYPGPAIKASLTPPNVKYRAPLIGEHNSEIYEELGLSETELSSLEQRGVI